MTRKEKADKAYKLAHKYEREWGACSQPTIRALQETYNENFDEAFKALGSFAAGGACECDGTCGAYAATIYFLGSKYGRSFKDIGSNSEDPLGLKKHKHQFVLVKKLHEKFINVYGSIICSQIHRKLFGRSYYVADPDDLKKIDKAGAHDWSCTSVCGNAAKWAVEILEEFKPEK